MRFMFCGVSIFSRLGSEGLDALIYGFRFFILFRVMGCAIV